MSRAGSLNHLRLTVRDPGAHERVAAALRSDQPGAIRRSPASMR